MKNPLVRWLTGLVIVTSLALAGCGEEMTGTNGGIDLVQDPLDGVLNSTEGSTPSDPQSRIDRLAEALGLDDEQKAAITAAYDVFRTGVQGLREQVESGDLDREEAREAAHALREVLMAEFQTILTDEQWSQFQEMMQNRDGHRRRRGGR